MKEFFNSLNISSKFYNKIKKYLELEETHDEVCEILKEKIEEGIFVDGMDYDGKGITEGFDYDEIYIEDVSNISFEFEFVDVIKENKISVTLSCKADISVNCSYLDTDNSVWDSEEKRYIYMSFMDKYWRNIVQILIARQHFLLIKTKIMISFL
ncbi:MAG: hypothetical protein LKF66_00890 [Clostridium tyrobutyricum]|jgi:hypothetical protein|nr:hypothetical protein [Clostridium tyrobutyricum]